MMDEWAEMTVRDLVEQGVIERPMDGNHGEIHPKAVDFVNVGIPFVMASDLVAGRLDLEHCARVSEVQARSLRKGFSLAGDVLISHKATMGNTAIVPEIDIPFVMLTPQVTYYRVTDPSRLSNRYLRAYFDSPPFQQLFAAWGQKGSTRAYLGITSQLDLPIIVPPIEVQRCIAHILGTLDDKIELNRRMSETLDAMARALFKSWFVDFEPVQVGSLVTAPEHLATGDAPGREESEAPSCASDLPAGWSFVPFGELLDVVKETIEPSDSPTESFVHFSIPSFDEGRTPKREAGAEIKSLKFRVPSGSVLMSKLNPEIDRVWLVDVPDETRSVCSTEFMVLRPRHPVDRTFVYFTARSSEFRTRLQGLVTGTSKSHQRAQIPSVLAIPVVSPPASVAAEWARRAEPLMRRVALGREESALLAALRDTLLPKLISGELRVPDAERFVEKALADGGSKS